MVDQLSHRAAPDDEAALSAQQILIEMIETEKTCELFFENNAEILGRIMDLAVDCSNVFNQKYLLAVLSALVRILVPAKSVKPTDFDEDDAESQDNSERTARNQFDVSLPVNAQAVALLDKCREMNFMQSLLLNVSGGVAETYQNTFTVVRKIGLVRLRSLELFHQLLQMMYPSKNRFARCMRDFMQMQENAAGFEERYNSEEDHAEHVDTPEFRMGVARFLDTPTRRHLL